MLSALNPEISSVKKLTWFERKNDKEALAATSDDEELVCTFRSSLIGSETSFMSCANFNALYFLHSYSSRERCSLANNLVPDILGWLDHTRAF